MERNLHYNVSTKFIRHKHMFTIENQVSGRVFQTDSKGNILNDALAHGLNFPYGCQKGFCGKCKATIIEGEAGYEGEIPSGITPEEVADTFVKRGMFKEDFLSDAFEFSFKGSAL